VGKCDKPKDVCLIFDGAAELLVERGFARHITREEGMHVLDRAEQAGLVYTSNNSANRANLICNCCPFCCTVLRGKTQLWHPHAFEPSRFEARVKNEDCTGCGICAEERCPMKAIEMKESVASLNMAECIGCGLCVSACPSEAITLIERKAVPAVPAHDPGDGRQSGPGKREIRGIHQSNAAVDVSLSAGPALSNNAE